MKKTHKKIVGFLGLLAVAAVTTAAVFMPAPETQATSSVTDTIQVRVVGAYPDVYISNIINNEVTLIPEQSFTVGYSDVDEVVVTMDHTGMGGDTTTDILVDRFFADYEAGEENYVVHFVKNS